MTVYTPAQVAEMFRTKGDFWLRDGVRRRDFPHLRVGGAIRFTAEHVEQITRLCEEKRSRRAVPAEGQSQRSEPSVKAQAAEVWKLAPRSKARALRA